MQLRGGVHRQPRLAQRRDRRRHAHHRAVGARHRAVARLALPPRAHPAQALLGDLHRVERRVAEVQREAARLADRVLGAHQLGVLLDQEARAEVAARLLVGHAGEDHVAREARLVDREPPMHRAFTQPGELAAPTAAAGSRAVTRQPLQHDAIAGGRKQ